MVSPILASQAFHHAQRTLAKASPPNHNKSLTALRLWGNTAHSIHSQKPDFFSKMAAPDMLAQFLSKYNMLGASTQTRHGFEDLKSPSEILNQGSADKMPGYAATPRSQAKQANLQAQKQPKTTHELQKMLFQMQSLLNNMASDPVAIKDMAESFGPNMTFEDLMAELMWRIAREEENKLSERIQMLENGGHPGLRGWFSHRAADLAGMGGSLLGGALGGYFQGAQGMPPAAAAGQDLFKRTVNSFTGYNSEDSRQIQFEKLKHQMSKLSELMTCLSNILANMHATAKNTISNIRA